MGPKTIERIRKYTGHSPHVRFGSTEACLQVIAIPANMPDDEIMKAFEAGWSHVYNDKESEGYYIGREHYPFTRVKIVKSVNPEGKDYMIPCEIGEPGYLLTQGGNLFSGYIGDEEATVNSFIDGWYAGMKDIAFALKNSDGNLDYYWISRDSELLIRGGANYAYAQLSDELTRFIIECYKLPKEDFQLAVVGIRLQSEHEDSCCVTIDLSGNVVGEIRQQLELKFIQDAKGMVSKGARPDYLRFAKIPRNFKGAIIYPQLKKEFTGYFNNVEKNNN